MKRKDIKDGNTVKLIVFRNGFVEYFSVDDLDALFVRKFKIPARIRRKQPSMKKFSFRPPLPGLPF